MGSSLAGLLILAILLTGSLMIWRVTMAGNTLIRIESTAASQRDGERARTVASITTARGDRNNNTLSVTVKNDGATSATVSDFDDMDVLVFYDLAAQLPVRLTYTTTNPPPAGQWTNAILSGSFEPDIWNPTEDLSILATLVGATCAPGTVTVGFPNGITTTSPFVCAGLDLTFHSETTNIDSTTYYTFKNETPADGSASTVSVVFAEETTGRQAPLSNTGKFVFPLTGVTTIPAANWDLTYRLKRDKTDMGWVWFTNAFDISIDTVSGTHDGANDAAVLTDSGADFIVDGILVGDTIQNTTDGSSATVTAVTATTITGALAGGTDDDWDTSDAYTRAAPVNAWRDIDLSSFVPVAATGVVVEMVNSDTGIDYTGVLRAKEDTRDYMSNAAFQEIYRSTHRWQMIKLDSNRRIQGHVSNVAVDFKLLGYTVGPDPAYFIDSGVTPEITPVANNKWTTIDVTNYVDPDSNGVVLFVDSQDGGRKKYLIREQGGDEAAKDKINSYGNTVFFVGLNAAKHFEVKIDDVDIKLYLVAQTKGSMGLYITDIAVTDPTEGSWQELDADDYGIPTNANGLIFHFDGEKDKAAAIGFRHGDSTDDWEKDIFEDTHYQAAVGLRNSDNVWEMYMEDDKFDVWIAAYTRLIRLDVVANVDVVVRQSDGTIRSTLLTNVADTANITTDTWQTETITFAFPEYTVVDQTDYLEIDLYAEVTTNGSGESVSVDFRIDDPTLVLADQMRVAEVVP